MTTAKTATPRKKNAKPSTTKYRIPYVEELERHLRYTCFKTAKVSTPRDWYNTAANTVRDHVVERWVNTSESYFDKDPKRVYYLSLEFLIGRMFSNAALNLGIAPEIREGLNALGQDMERLAEIENDAALGNGGLGRLAACFLDSMATMDIPGTGYGIRYEYGMFRQAIVDGQQIENPDNWLRYGNVWEFQRPELFYTVKFYGHVVEFCPVEHETRHQRHRHHGRNEACPWVDAETVLAMAYDVPIPGYSTETVNNLRLWAAKATREFDLEHFNDGNYERSVEQRTLSE